MMDASIVVDFFSDEGIRRESMYLYEGRGKVTKYGYGSKVKKKHKEYRAKLMKLNIFFFLRSFQAFFDNP